MTRWRETGREQQTGGRRTLQEAVQLKTPRRAAPRTLCFSCRKLGPPSDAAAPPGPGWVPREPPRPRARSRSPAPRAAGYPAGRGGARALPPRGRRLPSGPTHSPVCARGGVGGRGGGGRRRRRPGVGRCAPRRGDGRRSLAGTGARGPHAQGGWQRSVGLGRPGARAQRPGGGRPAGCSDRLHYAFKLQLACVRRAKHRKP